MYHCFALYIGKIYLPSRGDTFVVAAGTAEVKIAWTFDDRIRSPFLRQWSFITTNVILAEIINDENVTKFNSSFPAEFEIEKPATLVLKNVDYRNNGTYEFWVLSDFLDDTSYVTVFVAGKCHFSAQTLFLLLFSSKLRIYFRFEP